MVQIFFNFKQTNFELNIRFLLLSIASTFSLQSHPNIIRVRQQSSAKFTMIVMTRVGQDPLTWSKPLKPKKKGEWAGPNNPTS